MGKLSIVGSFHVNLTFYWGILGVRYILGNYHKYRERELEASQPGSTARPVAAAGPQDAASAALPVQHAEHDLGADGPKTPRQPNRTLVRLSDLLRMTLDNVGAQEACR